MLVDSVCEVIGVGLNFLGYGLNIKNILELKVVFKKLDVLILNVKVIVVDEMKGYMI